MAGAQPNLWPVPPPPASSLRPAPPPSLAHHLLCLLARMKKQCRLEQNSNTNPKPPSATTP